MIVSEAAGWPALLWVPYFRASLAETVHGRHRECMRSAKDHAAQHPSQAICLATAIRRVNMRARVEEKMVRRLGPYGTLT